MMGSGAGEVEKTVYLHVGAPKTGTTYLQTVLWNNRERLAGDGFLYPLRRPKEHRHASLDLQQRRWGGKREPAAEGAWERLASRVREWPGQTAVISNELLGGATPEQAQRAVRSLQPAEVHVVFTARDLARQLASDWQEQIKHMHTLPNRRFLEDLAAFEIDAPEPFGRMFWGLHDPVRVLGKWSAAVPPERVHLVTVPQPGARNGLLWERFAGLLGLDPARYDTYVGRDNTSMGVIETELVRRINLVLGGSLHGQYDPLVRVLLGEKILARRDDLVKLELPREYHSWAFRRSKEIIAGVEAAGYDVVGDPDELLPLSPAEDTPQPHEVESPELLEAAIDAVAGLLQHHATGRGDRRASVARIRELEGELELRRGRPIRTVIRDLSERHALLNRARMLWWHGVEKVCGRH